MSNKEEPKPIILRAHYDGEKIQLDDPFDLERNARLTVTVLRSISPGERGEAWLRFSQQHLEAAYGEDEPDYSLDLIREWNPASRPKPSPNDRC